MVPKRTYTSLSTAPGNIKQISNANDDYENNLDSGMYLRLQELRNR